MYGEDFDSRPELISLYISMRTKYGGRDHIQAYGLRAPDYKFLRSVKVGSNQSTTTAASYYDLVEDPGEKRPISDLDDARVQRGWDDLERALDAARSHWERRAHSSRAELTTDLTEESVEELRALGYLDVGETPGEATVKRPWGLAPMARIEREPAADWKGPLAIGLTAAALIAVLVGWIRRRTGTEAD